MSDTEHTLARAVIEHFHGPDNRHSSWWLNTAELAEAFQPILAAHDAELTNRVRAKQRETDITAVVALKGRYGTRNYEDDNYASGAGDSLNDATAAIREATDD